VVKSIYDIHALKVVGIIVCFTIHAFAFALPANAQDTPVVGIRINNGQKFTNKKEVLVEVKSLKVEDRLIAEMQIGLQHDLTDGKWVPYTTARQSITLQGGDGAKRVYVRLKDKAGNISSIESAEILLDTTPPYECKIMINKGDEFTSDRQMRVLLILSAKDAARMQISNSAGFEKAVWENYSESKSWILAPPGDGRKSVYARFMDAAQNISEPVFATILLDTQPPKNGTIVINNNDKYTRTPKVTLNIYAEDAEKVMLTDRLGKTEVHSFESGNNALVKEWEFDTIQGVKTIRAFFIDKAGNRTATAATDDIIFDSKGPPPPVVQINNGAKYTNHPDGIVNLKVAARVAPATIRMQVSNSPDFKNAPITDFKASVNGWQLEHAQDGTKSVYARFFDEAGNPSDVTHATIVLNRKKPVVSKFEINGGAEWATSSKVKINIDAEGAAFMQLGITETIFRGTVWEPFKNQIDQYQLPVGDGEKIVYLRLKDEAENISEPTQAKIMIDTKPPVGEISINNKSKFTNNKDKKVNLQINYDDASEMLVSETADFKDASWQSVKKEITGYTLSGDDGPKTVFLRLKDKAGNISKPISANIILDRTAPEDSRLLINNGARWLNNPMKRVTLTLMAKGASEMIIGNTPSLNDGKWEPVKPLVGWTLLGDDGQKKVFAKFRDEAGNETSIIEASVMLDTKAPELERFLIDKGVQFTNNKELKTSITLKSSGADFMALANKPFEKPESASWRPYSEQSEWHLEGGDGAKTVFLILKDSAGNISPIYTANIILDRTPPQGGKILINNNERHANHPEKKVSLFIGVNHSSEMMISNFSDFKDAKWETFRPRKDNWILAGEDGEKTVYARFRDEAGNISETAMAKIILDRKPPTDPKISINNDSTYTSNRDKAVRLRLHATEAKSMIISQDKNFKDAKWDDYQTQKIFQLTGNDGEKEVFVKFKDEAGNETAVVSSKITLDITPPSPVRFIINQGEEWCNAKDKKVVLNIEAEGAHEMMVSSNPDFKDGQWKPYARQMDFILPGDDGDKHIYIKFRDKAGNISTPVTTMVKLKRTF
jgi:hypothetical protein